MALQLSSFSESVRSILASAVALPLPLVRNAPGQDCKSQQLSVTPAQQLFPSAQYPKEALSGLLLRLNCWEESHQLSQDLETVEGSYWHGIAHRMEPDYPNAGYWFRRVGKHPIFPRLHVAASDILASERLGWRLKEAWDPFLFNGWCEEASQAPGSSAERVATLIQNIEWELLFTWCGSNFEAAAGVNSVK